MIDNETDKEVNDTKLIEYGTVFYQMLKFPWFKDMIADRFDIQNIINHDEKAIYLTVVEVPPQEAMKRMQKRAKADEEAKPKIIMPS